MNPFKPGDIIKSYDHYADKDTKYIVISVKKDYVYFQYKEFFSQIGVHYKTCRKLKPKKKKLMIKLEDL